MEFSVVSIAALYVGAIIAPINVTYGCEEIKHAFSLSKPKIVFSSPYTIANVAKVVPTTPSVKILVVFGEESPMEGVPCLKNFVEDKAIITSVSFRTTTVKVKEHTAAILCSSGTTGLPKGVELTHFNLNVCISHHRLSLARFDDCVLLALLPWFHAFGFVTHLVMLVSTAKMVVVPKFDETLFLSSIQSYNISLLFLVPPLVVFLDKHPAVQMYDLTSLREIWCGAAPLSKEVQYSVSKKLNVRITQGFGMTETTLGVLKTPMDTEVRQGSSGVVVPGTMAKVIDLETGRNLGPNKKGELCFKGDLIMKGYVGDRSATEGIIDENQWLHTGDIGYYDEDGYFFVVDRLKELIKYKGYQVPPAELEALLLTHKGVKDAAVVGIPDEEAGELPLAFIVRQADIQVTEKEIIEFVASKVSPAKRLHGGVRFIDEIPKNASGKLLRRVLRDQVKNELNLKSKL